MSNPAKIRINVNTRALPKMAGLLSNTVILGANAYLITSSIAHQFRDRKQQRVSQTLEMGAQMASALAGITKIIVEAVEHGQTDNSL